ncbi:hypothetical protein [Vibrio crassostreae]|uniref:hypothetical protein n=1 Tax=Vibrio crassostreae TaxID=246167 RepID=UPI001B310E86|nr:hypothetical protein [Vibrio crassostreae]
MANYSARGYEGQKIEAVQDAKMWVSFDNPNVDTDKPTLVLAATRQIPSNTDGWILATQTCGGFGCYQTDAAIMLLSIKPEMMNSIQRIVDEDWYKDSLDYEGFCLPESEPVKAYIHELAKIGITFNALGSGVRLSQALYPVDAVQFNLDILTHDQISLKEIDPNGECGLIIFMVGDNCD